MLNQLMHEQNRTRTENGALAWHSTGGCCLDFFAAAGAVRGAEDERVLNLFLRAYAENPDDAMKILFYARDVRGGLGERRIFRLILSRMAFTHPESAARNLAHIPEYGRWDDMLAVLDTPCEAEAARLIGRQLERDRQAMAAGKSVSLLAKWLPSLNTSSSATREQAGKLRRLLGMNEREYRRCLSSLRAASKVLECDLSRGDYGFTYEKLPSKALLQYRRAFLRHDKKRYRKYLEDVLAGRAKGKAAALYPYELVQRCIDERVQTDDEIHALDAAWRSLPDFTDGRNALAVVDGSGSMYWGEGSPRPIDVALSLGLYFAERNRGHFRNHFITFSESPRLVKVQGRNLRDRVQYCMSYNEVANTDLYNVFMLILVTAIKNHLPQEELPELLYILSDMEFDRGVTPDKTVYQDAKEKFEEYGYRLPTVVYWNIASRNEQYPVMADENGTALVSGASPSVFSLMMEQNITPDALMRQVLDSDRYRAICA